ncbi:alpha/beta fold hydrolase [Salinactinospora qingdaonensis]|uniref:Alpha/beta hydrolase n=1 Tax=Salinactinospora qingdaonensis TaxID=702744 RepID=A0ABP7EUM5_9ACTN
MNLPADDWTAETATRTLTTDDGARLALTVVGPPAPGDGSTVVLAHGWAANRGMWRRVVDILADAGYTSVLYDQRGHGASTLGREPIGIERLGRDLATVLDHVDATDAVLAGHSGGGFAAMAYATADVPAAAARLRGMLLLGTAAHDQDTSEGEVRMMGNPLFSWALARPWLGRRMLRHTMGNDIDAPALEVNRRMFAGTPGQVRAACFRCSRGMDLRRGLAAVTVPTTVLSGEVDKVIAPHLGEVIAQTMPHAHYERLADAGHMLPLERPERVAQAVVELASP